jgi:hypothetical protein
VPGAMDQEQLNRRLQAIGDRLGAIEAQVAVLSEKAGVPYSQPAAEVPPEAAKLAADGDTLGAVKKYRELTGADADAARKALGL